MKPRLILVHGKARSGKGEVAKRLCEKYGYVEVGFADYLKELAVEVFGWSAEEIWTNRTPESRKFMQLLGEIGRMVDPDFWIKKLEERLKGKYKDKNIVISDLRYENEAVWGRHNNGQLWIIKRPDAEKMIEKAKMNAEKERQKIIETAQKKVKKLCEKAEESAKKDIDKIKKEEEKEISRIKETADKNISKAVDLIIKEIEKGE